MIILSTVTWMIILKFWVYPLDPRLQVAVRLFRLNNVIGVIIRSVDAE